MERRQNKNIISYANGPSLEEINGTVSVPQSGNFWKNLLAFSGPGALVAVGLDGGQQRLHQLRRDLVSHVSDVHGGDILRVKAILIAVP